MASQGRRRKNAAAVRLALRRSRKLSRARRSEIARQAARARWARRPASAAIPRVPHIWQVAEELTRDIPAEEWSRLPADLIDNLDHYLYGWPKQ